MEPGVSSSWQEVLASLLEAAEKDGLLEDFLKFETVKKRVKYVMDKYVRLVNLD